MNQFLFRMQNYFDHDKWKLLAGIKDGSFHGKVHWPEHDAFLLPPTMTWHWERTGTGICVIFRTATKVQHSFVLHSSARDTTTEVCQKVWRCKTIPSRWCDEDDDCGGGDCDFRTTVQDEGEIPWMDSIYNERKEYISRKSTRIIYHRKLLLFFSDCCPLLLCLTQLGPLYPMPSSVCFILHPSTEAQKLLSTRQTRILWLKIIDY